ncbi:long-chain acyl-CoA synthetase [Leucobacter komagatae]|uniref:Long-chain acyl-CoA synthetase n=1 Tax=Leucobacter komagatae TaxID=55969 RepID=A0A542XYA2_9MICO|nr:long-chain fatty acid--CoA ligase [Leucobacter komagatae]TQL40812.1 long-chain acyl-CoA synthetase [Leucobacter komagatae]
MTNLAMNLVNTASKHSDRPAIRLGDSVLTYAQFEHTTQLVAALLEQQGVRPGDRVALMLPNVPHFALLYYGALRLGAIVVPMNPLLKEREVAYHLSDSGARLLFVWTGFEQEGEAGAVIADAKTIVVEPTSWPGLLAGLDPVPGVHATNENATAVILYTSGTTGKPKGAELTHANIARNVEICADELIFVTEQDVVFGGLPLFHVFGQTASLNAAIYAGACLTLLPKFDPQAALETIARDRVTIFQGVPTMYTVLAHFPDRAAYDTSSLRVCVSGGAALPVEVLGAFESAYECVVLEGYGLSETSPVVSINRLDRRRAGSIGVPVSGVEVRIIDEAAADVAVGEIGELVVRGHNVMKSYWGKPAETSAAIPDGWFRTGDLARRDDDDFLYIVDRKKDLIIRSGYNVYPREVEEVLYEHPAVAEAAVIAFPHPEFGDEIAAVVALKPGAEANPEELREFVKSRVAAYKYPRVVELVAALPKGATGKILKRAITLTSV